MACGVYTSMKDTMTMITELREAAAKADRDADSEFPGSYYRKAHRARARRLRAKADKLALALQEGR